MTPAKSLPDQVTDAASHMKDKVNNLSRSAAERLEESRTTAASSLDATASALHDSGEKVADIAHCTADKLSSSAKYLRTNDVKSILVDVQRVIRKNPGLSLLVAGIVGFSVARALRSSDY